MDNNRKKGRHGRKHGPRRDSVKKYAEAIKLARNPRLSLKEIAEQCQVSYDGFTQQLKRHHNDIRMIRKEHRIEAKSQRPAPGELRATGGISKPREKTVHTYALALELYKNTDLSVRKISSICGVSRCSFTCYLQHWHITEVIARKKKRTI